MKNIMKKILVVLLAIITITAIINVKVAAEDSNFDFNAFEGEVASAANVKSLVNNTAITAISVARIVCVTIAIVILLVIAMKYMMSAPGDRADIKKHAIHYVIGAFILFAVTGILSIIDSFAKAIK